jgi:methionine-rich copper-binding protein CopC
MCWTFLRAKPWGICLFTLVLLAIPLSGHAILKQSVPAPHSVIPGPNVHIRLQFNTRVDAAHSRIYLAEGSTSRPLGITAQPEPGTLLSGAQNVPAGEHRILWQVLAVDGHITRGEVPFTVH